MKILLLVQLFFIVCNGVKCPKNKWYCYRSNECILLNNVCDYNKFDCTYGEDEDYKFCLKWKPKHNLIATTATISSTIAAISSTTATTATFSSTTATTATISSTTAAIAAISSTTPTISSKTDSKTSTTAAISKLTLENNNLKIKSIFIKRKTYIYIIIILIQLIIISGLFIKLRKRKQIPISNVYLEPTKLNDMYETIQDYETVL